ncbi:N-acetyltransferase [Desulfohalobium retbaense]|uniref:GCN5-related N-acetyltransferase n=1 Tax=Desulfohalobium retbaense (strain ATCC 49708 / DSM 5692 / JCM 16813 / HR100) TaxID=485915 RepID=C8X155_DESRD|nr:N-acetyltransferase [Desulfohalobium retbaense]ACV68152.1 GCN5-related N-acetyltransferase [Desulfohalobium retbaense DSM 5692]
MNTTTNSLYLRKAIIQDVPAIHGLLMQAAKQELLLPRSYNELYSHLRDFYVVARRDGESPVGCCALTITWQDLAEIRSLVVDDSLRGQGWGRRLVETCLSEAVTLGVYRVFTLTYVPRFFEGLGFEYVSRDIFPQKVWADCLRCPKFPDCDEIAMLMQM